MKAIIMILGHDLLFSIRMWIGQASRSYTGDT